MSPATSRLAWLPEEIVAVVLTALAGPAEMDACRGVCRRWRQLIHGRLAYMLVTGNTTADLQEQQQALDRACLGRADFVVVVGGVDMLWKRWIQPLKRLKRKDRLAPRHYWIKPRDAHRGGLCADIMRPRAATPHGR